MHSQDLNKARSRGRGLSFLLFLSSGLGPVTRLDAGGLGHQAWWPVKVSQCRTGKVQGRGGGTVLTAPEGEIRGKGQKGSVLAFVGHRERPEAV